MYCLRVWDDIFVRVLLANHRWSPRVWLIREIIWSRCLLGSLVSCCLDNANCCQIWRKSIVCWCYVKCLRIWDDIFVRVLLAKAQMAHEVSWIQWLIWWCYLPTSMLPLLVGCIEKKGVITLVVFDKGVAWVSEIRVCGLTLWKRLYIVGPNTRRRLRGNLLKK